MATRTKSFATFIDNCIQDAVIKESVKTRLVEFGADLAFDVSKEEYIEFVKRNLKEFSDDIVTVLEDEL